MKVVSRIPDKEGKIVELVKGANFGGARSSQDDTFCRPRAKDGSPNIQSASSQVTGEVVQGEGLIAVSIKKMLEDAGGFLERGKIRDKLPLVTEDNLGGDFVVEGGKVSLKKVPPRWRRGSKGCD